MKKFSVLFVALLSVYGSMAQVCITQQMDTRSSEVIGGIEEEVTHVDFSGQRSVGCVQTVVHVIWKSAQDNVSDSSITACIDLINMDLRRQNADANLTPNHFLPVAADMEIELTLAQVDPFGQPTNGITHTFTDSSRFEMILDHMKYDSTGGRTAWDTEHYLNIWVVRAIVNDNIFGPTFSYGVLPGSTDPDRIGLVVDNFLIEPNNWRAITHEIGHFLGLLDLYGTDSCINNDLVNDTPIGLYHYAPELDCIDTIISCDNDPYGEMFMNYMSPIWVWGLCQNLFTEGQKDRMDNWLMTQVPGWLDCYSLDVFEAKHNILVAFPSPTAEILNFQSSSMGNYSILDVQGRTVLSGRVVTGKNGLNVSEIPSGVYFLRLQTDSGTYSARFVKN